MQKVTFFPAVVPEETVIPMDHSRRRVTVQLRQYDDLGEYEKGEEPGRGNETIWIKGYTLDEVYEIIKGALMNDRHLNTYFEVEK